MWVWTSTIDMASPCGTRGNLEATTGFEPVNRGFADLRVEPLHHVASRDRGILPHALSREARAREAPDQAPLIRPFSRPLMLPSASLAQEPRQPCLMLEPRTKAAGPERCRGRNSGAVGTQGAEMMVGASRPPASATCP